MAFKGKPKLEASSMSLIKIIFGEKNKNNRSALVDYYTVVIFFKKKTTQFAAEIYCICETVT